MTRTEERDARGCNADAPLHEGAPSVARVPRIDPARLPDPADEPGPQYVRSWRERTPIGRNPLDYVTAEDALCMALLAVMGTGLAQAFAWFAFETGALS